MHNQYLRFPGGRVKALTLSYDDGVEQDIRLLELMKAHDVFGTFNLNSCFPPEDITFAPGTIHRRMPLSRASALYADPHAEVAVHSVNHPFLERLPGSLVMREVVEDRATLEKMTGGIVRGMAYPFGTYSDTVVEILRLAGIAYSRTCISTEDFRLPADPLRLTATCHHNNPRLAELADKFLAGAPDCDPWLFYLWGHSYEFEANANWDVIERFLDKVAGHGEIWYATNITIVDYCDAFARLRYSADAGIVENPTSTELWFCVDGKTCSVPAGGTITL